MKPNELEKLVLKSMLDDPELKPVVSAVNFDALTVMERDFTGTGFCFGTFQNANNTCRLNVSCFSYIVEIRPAQRTQLRAA